MKTETYLLADRKMGSLSLGLSMFVSWFSIISYTAWPGEIVAHGPAVLAGILASPLVLWFLGWVVMPRIIGGGGMARSTECGGAIRVDAGSRPARRLTAYQLLPFRTVQLAASAIFVSIRLAWMGMIVYIASAVILGPMGRVPPWTIAVALVVSTVLYTALGFRMVVYADVVQAVIMLAGAVAVLCTVSNWWPEKWPEHWVTLQWAFDPHQRATLSTAILSGLVMGCVVKSSDQMAVQRFLAAGTVRKARGVLFVGFVVDVILTGLLVCVGLALLSHYGTNVVDSDRLFAHYVTTELSPWLRLMVVTALVVAAMSSLSSGINSVHSTLIADAGLVRWRVLVCCGIGVAVLAMSGAIGLVEGNIVERCYKIVNLLATPLGGLVLSCLFIPRVRAVGILIGAVLSIAVVVWITYFSAWTFLLAAPCGLAVHLVTAWGTRK